MICGARQRRRAARKRPMSLDAALLTTAEGFLCGRSAEPRAAAAPLAAGPVAFGFVYPRQHAFGLK